MRICNAGIEELMRRCLTASAMNIRASLQVIRFVQYTHDMAIDMKEKIAKAALELLKNDSKRKLTVKDIVEECNITRQ